MSGKKDLELRANFRLDSVGQPLFTEDDRGKRHYEIEVYVAGVTPKTESITYKLDDSYYNPVREVFRRDDGFRERITSYGDYTVIVSPSGDPSLAGRYRGRLSDALSAGSESVNGDRKAIQSALDYIREH